MPRPKLTAEQRRANEAQKKARWRQRVASQTNQNRQPDQFIPFTTTEYNNDTVLPSIEVDPEPHAPEKLLSSHNQSQPSPQEISQQQSRVADEWEPLDNGFSDNEIIFPEPGSGSPETDNPSIIYPEPGSRSPETDAPLVSFPEPGSGRFKTRIVQTRSPSYEEEQELDDDITGELDLKSPYIEVEDESEDGEPLFTQDTEHQSESEDSDDGFMDIDDLFDPEAENDHAASLQLLEEQQQGQREDTDYSVPDDDELALKLALHLHQFHGCEPGSHQEVASTHRQTNDHQSACQSLDEVSGYIRHAPQVLSRPQMLKWNDNLQRQPLPDWQGIFEGRFELLPERVDEHATLSPSATLSPGPTPERAQCHVCIEESQIPHPLPTDQIFDIDSFLGFAQNLAVARQGFWLNLVPQFHQNIQKNIHLHMQVPYLSPRGERLVKVKVHKVPHYCLGKAVGPDNINLYVFFPRQYDRDKPTNFPGKKAGEKHRILKDWTDRILIPAIAQVVPSHVAQHLPLSWIAARMRAQAYQETYSRKQLEVGQRKIFYYILDSQYLGPIWQEIQRLVRLPGNRLYQDIQLFFSTKNTKLSFKRPTLAQTWRLFEQRFQYTIDLTHIDPKRVWFDLGKETACQSWHRSFKVSTSCPSPATYLWRPCCLKAFSTYFRSSEKESKILQTPYYTGNLRDCQDMTLEMHPSSAQYSEGCAYIQFYASNKEGIDAGKVKPFRHEFLNKLTWDPKVLTMLEYKAKAKTVTTKNLEENWIMSKNRLRHSLREGRRKSYGVREEYRITFAFFRKMQTHLKTHGLWDQSAVTAPDHENLPYWQLSTQSYTSFLEQHANKFAFAIEWILAQNPDRSISFERCKVLAMLLQSLKYCYDSVALQIHPELWRDTIQRKQAQVEVTLEGMGLQETLQSCGYGWLMPKVNWSTLVFQAEISTQMLFENSALRDTYRRRGTEIGDIKTDLQDIELAGRWLAAYGTHPALRNGILKFIAGITTCHFRKEIFYNIKNEIRPEYRQSCLAGRNLLCHNTLKQVLMPACFQGGLYIADANRSKIRTVQGLVNFLWDFHDQHQRTRWENRGYRSLHRQALDIVNAICGTETADQLHDWTKRIFVLNTWIVPYPSESQFLRKDKGRRIWLSIYAVGRVPYQQSRKLFRKRRLGFPFLRLWALRGDSKEAYMPWFDLARGPSRDHYIMQGQPRTSMISQGERGQLGKELEDIWLEEGSSGRIVVESGDISFLSRAQEGF